MSFIKSRCDHALLVSAVAQCNVLNHVNARGESRKSCELGCGRALLVERLASCPQSVGSSLERLNARARQKVRPLSSLVKVLTNERTNEVSFTLRRKEMKMINETIAGKPEKADDSFKLCNCSIHESVSPVLRPFGLRFSNETCVCWSSVGG